MLVPGLRHAFIGCRLSCYKDKGRCNALQNDDGWTPLHEACCLGLADVVEALLQHGADATARCKDGTTPLHKAARAGNKASVAMLIQAGADVSAVDKVYYALDGSLNEASPRVLKGLHTPREVKTEGDTCESSSLMLASAPSSYVPLGVCFGATCCACQPWGI